MRMTQDQVVTWLYRHVKNLNAKYPHRHEEQSNRCARCGTVLNMATEAYYLPLDYPFAGETVLLCRTDMIREDEEAAR